MTRQITRRELLAAGALGMAATLGLAACGGQPAQESEPAEQDAIEEPEQPEEVEKHTVGETVETDLARLTLNRAAFAIALNSSLPIGTDFNVDNEYFCPKEYVAEEDADNPFVAPKGSTLVFYEVVVENLDRAPLELDDSSLESEFISVTYDGENYTTFEEKKYGWEVRDLDGEQDWNSLPVANLFASVGVRDLYRAYATVPFEPASLGDSFDLSFTLPCSDGTTKTFTFSVNQ